MSIQTIASRSPKTLSPAGAVSPTRLSGSITAICIVASAIYRVSEVGFISEIAVTRLSRRLGVGRALIDGARDWFRARHVLEFQLSTAVWNEQAQQFWKAVGGEPLLVRYRFPVDPDR